MKKLIIVISLLVSFSNSFSQTSCYNFHRKYCAADEDKGGNWLYNAQSRSSLFTPGTFKLRCVIYKGMDYRMSICTEKPLSNPVFKIYDARTNEQLFDSKNPATNVFEFQSTGTRQLVIEVEVPKAGSAKPTDVGCVGFLILHRLTDKQGF